VLPLIDAAGLTADQLDGIACCIPNCQKRWPRPRSVVGRTWDGRKLVACDSHDVGVLLRELPASGC
jgi:hypothetical protein